MPLDPEDPCIFQLSGGTTGVPKLIPRTHNDYAYNSKTAAQVCGVTGYSVLLLMLPIAHNLPLACPGVQGFFFNGGDGGAQPEHAAGRGVSPGRAASGDPHQGGARRC